MSDAKDWLRIAKSNLKRAKTYYQINDKEIRLEEYCFDLQQCVEKALKALFVYNKIVFLKTHSISALITILQKHSIQLPEELLNIVELTKYAVETRYPDSCYEISEEEFNDSVYIAEALYKWVEDQVD